MSDSLFVPHSGPRETGDQPEAETLLSMAAEALTINRERQDDSGLPPGICLHRVNGVDLLADPAGIAWWQAERAILVADLHLEKGSSAAHRGQMLPPYDTIATLQRLSDLIAKWAPRRVIALGDSFHDEEASARLPLPALRMLQAMMTGHDWLWISGNHDPKPPKRLGGDVAETWRGGGLVLRHEPQLEDCTGEIAGHLHPKARVVVRGRSLRRSCFAASDARMILPSFGAYTGGLDVFHPAFHGLFSGRDFHALMRGNERIYRVAAAKLR